MWAGPPIGQEQSATQNVAAEMEIEDEDDEHEDEDDNEDEDEEEDVVHDDGEDLDWHKINFKRGTY